MTTLIALLALAAPSLADVQCSGNLQVPGGFLSGRCNGNYCSGSLSGSSASGNGYCGGVSVQVRGQAPGGFVNGNCNGRNLSIYLNSAQFSLQGYCSGGGQFSGTARTNGGFVNGTCEENGNFNVFVGTQQATFSGTCR